MSEIVGCPRCHRKLEVPADFIGRQVQCPECQSTFVAATTAVSAQQPTSKAPTSPPNSYEQSRRRHDFDEEEERRRRRRRDDDYDDDDDLGDIHPRRIRRDYLAPHRGTMLLVLGVVGLVGGLSVCI